jgi:hypothetical protein
MPGRRRRAAAARRRAAGTGGEDDGPPADPGEIERDGAGGLEVPDAYWYDRHGAPILPVLRLAFDDPAGTWFHLRAAGTGGEDDGPPADPGEIERDGAGGSPRQGVGAEREDRRRLPALTSEAIVAAGRAMLPAARLREVTRLEVPDAYWGAPARASGPSGKTGAACPA